jgi:hypothetical protein
MSYPSTYRAPAPVTAAAPRHAGITTHSGFLFDFNEPEEAIFSIADIAHALSHICRFAGHTREFYSVAQHSVLVADQLPPHLKLAGLLHDAAEAFLGDVSSPLKAMLPDYRAIEARVEAVVLQQFGLAPTLPPEVKAVDLAVLVTEQRDLMPGRAADWAARSGAQPYAFEIVPLAAEQARALFMQRYQELIAGGWVRGAA